MNLLDLYEMRDRRDAYQRDYDSSVSGMGRGADHRGLRQELAHERNNIQIAINGRPWKVVAGRGTADSAEERSHLESMKQWAERKSASSGKKWTVYLTGAEVSEDATNSQITEFATAPGGGDSGNYFQALASAWYNGTFDSGSLEKGIKSQQDVERLLQRGIVCPDGVTRKYGIDYNSDFDGVVISSDDYYEHADHDETDSRTGKPFGPYDYMEFGGEELDESAKWRDPKYKDQLYTQEKPDYNNSREYDNAMWYPKPKGYKGRKEPMAGGEFPRTDPLVRGAGIGRSGIKHNINLSGKRKGLPSRDQITSLKQSIRDISGQHTRANLPEQGVAEGHADQQRKIFKKNGEPVGEVGIDRESSPGVGQYYIKHYASGTDLSGYDSREEAVEELRHLVNQGVAEEVDTGQYDARKSNAKGATTPDQEKSFREKIKQYSKELEQRQKQKEQGVAESDVDSDGYSMDHADSGEYDYEGDQARDQMNTIVRAARRLDGMLDDNENMPEWVQMKVTLAADYLDTAADYIESNQEPELEEGERGRGRPPTGQQDTTPVTPGRVEKTATGIRHHADASRYGGTEPDEEDDRLMSKSHISRLGKMTEPDIDEGKKVGNMDADAFDAAMARLKQLAGAGPLKTVWDPTKRVYRNVPVAVQPKK